MILEMARYSEKIGHLYKLERDKVAELQEFESVGNLKTIFSIMIINPLTSQILTRTSE